MGKNVEKQGLEGAEGYRLRTGCLPDVLHRLGKSVGESFALSQKPIEGYGKDCHLLPKDRLRHMTKTVAMSRKEHYMGLFSALLRTFVAD